jgi:hypothetical protein
VQASLEQPFHILLAVVGYPRVGLNSPTCAGHETLKLWGIHSDLLAIGMVVATP